MIALPHISEEDYEDFRLTLTSAIPETYGEWLSLHLGWRSKWADAGTKDVLVTPDQFRRFLFTSGGAVSIKTLFQLAERSASAPTGY